MSTERSALERLERVFHEDRRVECDTAIRAIIELRYQVKLLAANIHTAADDHAELRKRVEAIDALVKRPSPLKEEIEGIKDYLQKIKPHIRLSALEDVIKSLTLTVEDVAPAEALLTLENKE